MTKYSDELEASCGAWLMCTQCGTSYRARHGGRKKMQEHFRKEHSDLKESRKGDVDG